MKINRAARLILKILAVPLIFFVIYLALLCFPKPFFRSSANTSNLTLYSDVPFTEEEGEKILELVQAKLTTSTLYNREDHHAIFICNARWRQRLFFNWKYGAGGLNYYPLTSNVCLCGARIGEDRLISASGREVPGDRTLDYFITHEISHTLTKQAAGAYHHLRLPEYVTEGYPDYVAKGASFDYEKARQAFLAEAPEMDRWGSGLYLRYHFLVAYLLDKKGWTVAQLLDHPPEQKSLEDEIRAE